MAAVPAIVGLEARVGKLLSIETGFTCNSRCQYCTQLDYRVIPQADQLDLTTEQIRARILWAKANGHDELGFSGGEPTIRPDFLDLVAFARDTGFAHIAVTTNGRMFAYPRFAQQAIANGLTRFTFSLHGATPDAHDTIAVAKGALQQALAGLDNIAAAAKEQGVRLHLMNNQILLPDNVHHIRDMVALLAPKGVRLFMIQPFIAQRSNVADLGRWFVPYADVVAAVMAALPVLQQYGARIKPYNVPNCLLTPLGREFVEPQFYGISVFREFEEESAGEFKPFKARQWFRIDACRTCTEVCPGFRIEQLPQEEMRRKIADSAAEFRTRVATTAPLLVGGTELLAPDSLRQLVAETAAAHGPIALLTAASERTTRPELAALIVAAHAAGDLAAVHLLAQPMDQRFLAQRVLEKGNLASVRELLLRLGEQAARGRALPPIRLVMAISDLVRLLDDPVLAGEWGELTRAAARLPAAVDLVLAVANFGRGQEPPDVARQAPRNLQMMARLATAVRTVGLRPVLATLSASARRLSPEHGAQMTLLQEQLASVVDAESWDGRLFRHPLADGPMEFVTWLPAWLIARDDVVAAVVDPKHSDGGALGDGKAPLAASVTTAKLPTGSRWRGRVTAQAARDPAAQGRDDSRP